MPESQAAAPEKRPGFTALLGQGIKQNLLEQANKVKEEDEDDISRVISRGFQSYFSIVSKSLYDQVLPHVLSFLLSLTPQQLAFLAKVQVNRLPEAPLYFPQEFKQSLHPFQLGVYGRSQVWKVPRGKFLAQGELSLAALVQPEAGQASYRQLLLRDHRFLKLVQEVPEFLGSLNEVQKRILANAVRHDVLLRYFFASVSAEQMRAFEAQALELRVGDAEQEAVLRELAEQMPAGKALAADPLLRVMDYKTEMCAMVDNIHDLEVFRCIDVDMPDNYIANLQVTQIQRLMKLKTELQGTTPDVREIQLTLKRFILDLDVKEAYEFAVLNQFLINEEELRNLPREERKSLLTVDFDRLAGEAAHFSFTNAEPRPADSPASSQGNDTFFFK